MPYLKDILDTDKLEDLILNKRINVQVHPDLPLRIYNYSNMAQFANEWSHEERVCRGLIVGPDDEIIARGPSKFFNYGQPGAPEVAMDDTVWVTRKEDGSLGIAWHYEGHYGIATRGSFTSEQAQHATAMLTDRYKAMIRSLNGTEILEIVYPENRIVLDYGGLDKLISLGVVNNQTGIIEGRTTSVFIDKDAYEMTFAEALALPIPDDEEGYVLDIFTAETDGLRMVGHLKLKGDRYKELHGAIFGLSERRIWEAIGEGRDMDMFVADLPDELQPWAQGVVDKLIEEQLELLLQVYAAYGWVSLRFKALLSEVPRGDVAKAFVNDYPDIKGPLFSLLDGNEKAVVVWAHKQVRPEHRLFRVESQDNN